MQDYYNRRAPEYEAIYRRDDPVRQCEQAELAAAIQEAVRAKRVLEVACGTGYWTERAAQTAEHIVALDTAPNALEIALSKGLPRDKVDFREGDAYRLAVVTGRFDAGLAMFWLSHVPRSRMHEFLCGFHAALAEPSNIFFADNMLLEGIGGELIRKPGTADTFKRRTLADGSVHHILKNYYDRIGLESLLSPFAEELRIEIRTCFYWVQYTPAK